MAGSSINDIGARFPGVFLFVLPPKEGKRDVGRQMCVRIAFLVFAQQRFQLLVGHVFALLKIGLVSPLT